MLNVKKFTRVKRDGDVLTQRSKEKLFIKDILFSRDS